MQTDLYHEPTQQELVYEFIKTKGRVKTHELNEFATRTHINDPQTRARELGRAGKIWRMSKYLQTCLYGKIGEQIWSTYEADK